MTFASHIQFSMCTRAMIVETLASSVKSHMHARKCAGIMAMACVCSVRIKKCANLGLRTRIRGIDPEAARSGEVVQAELFVVLVANFREYCVCQRKVLVCCVGTRRDDTPVRPYPFRTETATDLAPPHERDSACKQKRRFPVGWSDRIELRPHHQRRVLQGDDAGPGRQRTSCQRRVPLGFRCESLQ